MSGFLKWLSDKTNPPKCRIPFTVNKGEYCLGEEIKGEVEFTSEEEFQAIQLYVSLECWENVKKTKTVTSQYGDRVIHNQEQYWDNAKLCSNVHKIFGACRVPQGFKAKYSFTLKIPSMARETYYSVDNYVKWYVSSVLEVNGRPNVQPEKFEVLVAKQQVTSSPQISKEVIKEIVLIPCSYCSELMPQTSVFCPNCGARRKG